jgi:hypothetical protein
MAREEAAEEEEMETQRTSPPPMPTPSPTPPPLDEGAEDREPHRVARAKIRARLAGGWGVCLPCLRHG